MPADLMPTLMIFAVVASLAGIVGLLLTGKRGKLDRRIDAMVGRGRPGDDRPETVAGMARSALPKMGKVIVRVGWYLLEYGVMWNRYFEKPC